MNLTAVNLVNSYADHIWDGIYASHLRLSRFATILQGGNDMYYDLYYTGSPPKVQRFSMRSNTTSVILRIWYPKAGVYQIKGADGTIVPGNTYDKNVGGPATI